MRHGGGGAIHESTGRDPHGFLKRKAGSGSGQQQVGFSNGKMREGVGREILRACGAGKNFFQE